MNRKGFLHHILFLDIETVPLMPEFGLLTEKDQYRFERKTSYQRQGKIRPADFYKKAGIWAEFGKIICISTACLKRNETKRRISVQSFYGDNEKQILLDFKTFLQNSFNSTAHLLCAHNGKEFDFPFIARRMLINRVQLPEILNLYGKKPWEVRHLDTMELWKFGDYKHYTSLDLLSSVLGIESPKNDLNGSDIRSEYYTNNHIDRIVAYCEKDTLAVVKVYFRLIGESIEDLEVLGVGNL